MKTCFLYPGQGAQYPGMGKDLWEASQEVKDLFKLASDATHMDLEALLFSASEEDLKATDKTQVAITLVNLSASLLLASRGVTAQGAAGFSLGEYSALWQAKVISSETIFALVKARGEIMERVSRSLDSPQGNPGMMAVIGLGYAQVQDVLQRTAGAYLANYNSPVQMVVAGTQQGLDAAEPALKEAGARRVIRLKVSGPFHCPLLAKVGEELGKVLKNYSFAEPIMPIYSNVTGGRIMTADQAKELCVKQVTSTVKWVDIENELLKEGFDRYLETGPGKVLAGLWSAVNNEYKVQATGTRADINSIT